MGLSLGFLDWTVYLPCLARDVHRFVMPGLVPGIHVFLAAIRVRVDGRDKPGHDEELLSVRSGLA
jgi:hypothetical protein